MHKKYALHLAGLAAAAVIAVSAVPASALTAAHQATATGATQGDCSICHVAHKAQGAQRLFPNEPTAGSVTTYGYMGAMCAEYCHNQLVALPRAFAGNTALVNVGSATVSNASHGLNLVTVAMPPNTVVPNTLPYGDGARGKNSQGVVGSFECTTCHDPHKNATGDASNALLRMDIDAICDECHTARGAGDVVWASGYGDTNALGSHPVGTDVQNDTETTPANSNIFIGGVGATAGATSFDVAYGASGVHHLGGHLIDGGSISGTTGINCVTCHAVHGTQSDPGAVVPPAPSGPFEDLLVISQGVQATGNDPLRIANGSGDTSNALCGGCHLESAGNDWNPGATAFGHPANNHLATLNMGVITTNATTVGWPYGANAVAGLMDLGVICESCHKPHAATTNSHILRLDEAALCQACHVAGPANHHPTNVAMAAMCDTDIDKGIVGTLECADCHSGNGAHNWIAAGQVGLSPLWQPTENARAAALDAPNVFTLNISKECIDCHSCGGTLNDPTAHNGNASTNGGTNSLQNRGNGSHFIGAATNTGNGNLAAGMITGVGFNAFTTAWPWNAVGFRGWSRFGGTAQATYEMVCESCHELQPTKNVAGNALLLYNYHDNEDVVTSRFCTGCHGEVPGGSSVHPLTGATISAAVDANRGTVTLITDPATGFANAGGSPGLAEYPATANRMNCDSCHQPHDAPTNSGSFIFEYYDNTAGSGLVGTTAAGVAIAGHRAITTQGIPHNTLCTQCHNY